MIFILFLLGLLFGVITLTVGLGQGNFGLAYLGMFTFLLIGLFIFSDGIDFENGMEESPLGSHKFITVYETHTVANDPIVNIIANTFFYLSFVGILLTTFITLRR